MCHVDDFLEKAPQVEYLKVGTPAIFHVETRFHTSTTNNIQRHSLTPSTATATMQPTSILLTVLGLSTYTSASSLQINNYCTDSLWTTLTSPSQPFAEPFEIPSGVANISDISGSGSTYHLSFTH